MSFDIEAWRPSSGVVIVGSESVSTIRKAAKLIKGATSLCFPFRSAFDGSPKLARIVASATAPDDPAAVAREEDCRQDERADVPRADKMLPDEEEWMSFEVEACSGDVGVDLYELEGDVIGLTTGLGGARPPLLRLLPRVGTEFVLMWLV